MLPGQGKTRATSSGSTTRARRTSACSTTSRGSAAIRPQPRETRHFLYLPAQAGADAVARSLDADGWSTSVERSEGAWLVVATRARTLTLDVVRETRARLAALASEHGGLYDGWEAPTI